MNAHVRSTLIFALLAITFVTQIGASCTGSDTSNSDRDDVNNSVSIPRDARKVAEGTGQLSYAARSDGRVYLYDIDERIVVDNRTLRSDERYSVNPDQNRIQIDNKKVSERDLKRKHDHRIYFLPNDGREDRDSLETDRLPRDAKNVAAGTGEITYRIREHGRIYVYDADTERVLLVREVHNGQTVLVDPDKDRVLVDGKK